MANIFNNPEKMVRRAGIALREYIPMLDLINHTALNPQLDNDSGGFVDVEYTPKVTANEDDHSSGPSLPDLVDITSTVVRVPATTFVSVRRKLNVKEKTYNLDDFTMKVINPSVVGMAEKIHAIFFRQAVAGFARNLVGTAGTNPSTHAHIEAALELLFDNESPENNTQAMINGTVRTSFRQLDLFKNQDYGVGDAGMSKLGDLEGVMFHALQQANTAFDRGDVTGTVLTDGVPVLAATIVHLDGWTAAAGTLKKGTRFVVAGDTQIYTTTADVTMAGNEADVPIYPGVTAALVAAGDGAAVTFEAAAKRNLVFNPDGVAGAIVSPAPLMSNSASTSFEGIGMRLSTESTLSDSSVGSLDTIQFDAYVGLEVIHPEMGVILQG